MAGGCIMYGAGYAGAGEGGNEFMTMGFVVAAGAADGAASGILLLLGPDEAGMAARISEAKSSNGFPDMI
jgi:hypothetical protein